MSMNPQIKDAAQQYLLAANILHEKGAFSGVLLPTILNAVFSIELHLKALNSSREYNPIEGQLASIVTAKPITFGHDLFILFNDLPKEIKSRLSGKYSDMETSNGNTLQDVMNKYSKTFIKVRYVFEDSNELRTVNVNELIQLANFLGGYE